MVGGLNKAGLSNSSLIFYLSNEQADDIYSILKYFDNHNNYRYIPIARDCLGFLRDVSEASVIGNFAKYIADYELLDKLISGAHPSYRVSTELLSFFSNHYHIAICEDENRSEVSKHFESHYGKLFRLDWQYVGGLPINKTSIAKGSYLESRLIEAQNTFRKYADIMSYSLNLSDNIQNKLYHHMNNSLSNKDLYHYQSLNYRIDIYNNLKKYPLIIDHIKYQVFDTVSLISICGLEQQCLSELGQSSIISLFD